MIQTSTPQGLAKQPLAPWSALRGTPFQPRWHHACAVVRGSIYLFGGKLVDRAASDDMYRYQPATGAWSKIVAKSGPSPPARTGHTLTGDERSGVLFLFGGRDAQRHFADVWIFDVENSKWREVAQQKHTNGHSLSKSGIRNPNLSNGDLGTGPDVSTTASLQPSSPTSPRSPSYRPRQTRSTLFSNGAPLIATVGSSSGIVTSSPSEGTSPIDRRMPHIATTAGGCYSQRNAMSSVDSTAGSVVDSLSCSVGSTTRFHINRRDRPAPRRLHTAVVRGNSLYVYGGLASSAFGDLWRLHPSADDYVWTAKWIPPPPAAGQAERNGGRPSVGASTIQSNYGCLSGGSPLHSPLRPSSPIMSGSLTARLNVDDMAESPHPRFAHVACVWKELMFIFGGRLSLAEEDVTDDLWSVNFETFGWTRVNAGGPIPRPRRWHAATVVNDWWFIHGGAGAGRALLLGDSHAFHFPTRKWQPLPRAATEPMDAHAIVCVPSTTMDHLLIIGGEIRMDSKKVPTNAVSHLKIMKPPLSDLSFSALSFPHLHELLAALNASSAAMRSALAPKKHTANIQPTGLPQIEEVNDITADVGFQSTANEEEDDQELHFNERQLESARLLVQWLAKVHAVTLQERSKMNPKLLQSMNGRNNQDALDLGELGKLGCADDGPKLARAEVERFIRAMVSVHDDADRVIESMRSATLPSDLPKIGTAAASAIVQTEKALRKCWKRYLSASVARCESGQIGSLLQPFTNTALQSENALRMMTVDLKSGRLAVAERSGALKKRVSEAIQLLRVFEPKFEALVARLESDTGREWHDLRTEFLRFSESRTLRLKKSLNDLQQEVTRVDKSFNELRAFENRVKSMRASAASAFETRKKQVYAKRRAAAAAEIAAAIAKYVETIAEEEAEESRLKTMADEESRLINRCRSVAAELTVRREKVMASKRAAQSTTHLTSVFLAGARRLLNTLECTVNDCPATAVEELHRDGLRFSELEASTGLCLDTMTNELKEAMEATHQRVSNKIQKLKYLALSGDPTQLANIPSARDSLPGLELLSMSTTSSDGSLTRHAATLPAGTSSAYESAMMKYKAYEAVYRRQCDDAEALKLQRSELDALRRTFTWKYQQLVQRQPSSFPEDSDFRRICASDGAFSWDSLSRQSPFKEYTAHAWARELVEDIQMPELPNPPTLPDPLLPIPTPSVPESTRLSALSPSKPPPTPEFVGMEPKPGKDLPPPVTLADAAAAEIEDQFSSSDSVATFEDVEIRVEVEHKRDRMDSDEPIVV